MTEQEYKNVFEQVRLPAAAKVHLHDMCAEKQPKSAFAVRRMVAAAMVCVLLVSMGTAVYAMDFLGISTWVRNMQLFAGRDYQGAVVIDRGDTVKIMNTEEDFIEIDKEAVILWEHAMDLKAENGTMILILDERRLDVTHIWGENGLGRGKLTCYVGGEACKLELDRSEDGVYRVFITIGERTELMAWDEDWPYRNE